MDLTTKKRKLSQTNWRNTPPYTSFLPVASLTKIILILRDVPRSLKILALVDLTTNKRKWSQTNWRDTPPYTAFLPQLFLSDKDNPDNTHDYCDDFSLYKERGK